MKDKITKWYKQGLWSKEQVTNAVKKGIITELDYYEIIGQFYEV